MSVFGLKIIPHGAAREVTGSCHELQFTGKDGRPYRVLLDCGLFQGHREEAARKNAMFSFNPKAIDAVILSHAHMDHVGRIPLLYKKGYRGPVHCTYATLDLSAVMLKDAGYIQEKDEEYFCKHLAHSMIQCEGPLYTQEDAMACMEIFKGHNYLDWVDIVPGLKVRYLDAGHIVGSSMVEIELENDSGKRRMGFSGDLGRSTLPIIRDPSAMPPVEVLICESTYGNRKHDDIATAMGLLKSVIIRTVQRGGKVIIPAFSLERTQEIIYDLHKLWDAKEIPAVPIIVDSPLAEAVTDVFMKHPECYDKEIFEQFLSRAHNPFQFSLVRYTATVDESKGLNGTPGPMIIMAAAGMCEAGRIRHHLKNELEDHKNTVLAVGYMAEGTLGRRIVDPAIHEVKIFDQFYEKKADVVQIDAYSGHGDMADLDRYILEIEGLKKLILVHGEPENMEPMKKRLIAARPGLQVVMPEREEVVEA